MLAALRGQTHYSPGATKIAIAPLDLTTVTDSDPIDAYYRFYAIDFRAQATQHIGWVTSGSEQVAAQVFLPENPAGTAVMCHGYYDHVGLYGHLIDYLLSHRLAVLAFDQPGHGLSTGTPATVDSFDRYVTALDDVISAAAEHLPQPWFLATQSMGGAVSLEYIARGEAPDFADVVLFAPLVRPAFWSVNSLVYQVAKRTITEAPRVITNNAENAEFITLMHKDPLQAKTLPVQWVTAMVEWMTRFERRAPFALQPKVIQGQQDKTVGWRYNMKVLQRLVDPEILYLPTARHHLVNDAPELRAQMWAWLDEHCTWPAV